MGSFKRLLPKMPKLNELELIDLVLEKYEANSLMDQLSLCLQSLKQISIINLTLNHCPIQQIMMISTLEVNLPTRFTYGYEFVFEFSRFSVLGFEIISTKR